MTNSTIGRWLAAGLVAVCATPLQGQEVVLTEEQQRRAGVRVEVAGLRSFREALPVFGEVARAPASTLVIRTVLHGHIETVEVEPGDRVEAGDTLLEMHSHDLQEMKGRLVEGHQAIRLAESRLAAGEQLLEVEGISALEVRGREQELLAARLHTRNLEVTLAEHGVPEHELEALRSGGDPSPAIQIRAPLGGVVLEVAVHPAAWTEELQPLVRLATDEAVELLLQVPPEHVAALEQGGEVLFRSSGDMDGRRRARVIKRLPQVDPRSRTVPVRAAIPDDGTALFPGELVEAELLVGAPRDGVAVPRDAVIQIAEQPHVFLRVGVGTYRAAPVALGPCDGTHYAISSGVQAGDEVVTAGAFLLKSEWLRGDG